MNQLEEAPTQRKALGSVLLFHRMVRELSQAEAARAIGINAATLSGYERGKTDVSNEMLDRIATAYGQTPERLVSQANHHHDYLFGRPEVPGRPDLR